MNRPEWYRMQRHAVFSTQSVFMVVRTVVNTLGIAGVACMFAVLGSLSCFSCIRLSVCLLLYLYCAALAGRTSEIPMLATVEATVNGNTSRATTTPQAACFLAAYTLGLVQVSLLHFGLCFTALHITDDTRSQFCRDWV